MLYHPAKFGGAQISPANAATKNVEFFCLCPNDVDDNDDKFSEYVEFSIISVLCMCKTSCTFGNKVCKLQ